MAAHTLALLALLDPTTTAAGVPQSDDFERWYGCWRAEGAPAGEAACIVPSGGGIRIVSLEDGAIRGDSRVYPDGRSRSNARDACTMRERAQWSDDRERIFLESELVCDGQVTRRSRGLMAFVGPLEWVSVQTITGDEGAALRTVRFKPATGVRLPSSLAGFLPQGGARAVRLEPVDEGDVAEAADQLDPETVREWLDAAGAPFQLTDAEDMSGSALDDLAQLSRPVEYRTVNVVRIIEPRGCIYGSCSWLRTYRCWDPWGYDRFAWHVIAPIAYVHRPVIIHVGIGIGIGRTIHIARYDGWRRDREWWRYDFPRRWVNDHAVGYGVGRVEVRRPGVSREGYTDRSRNSGEGRGTIVRRDEERRSEPGRAIGTVSRGSSPERGSGSGTRPQAEPPRDRGSIARPTSGNGERDRGSIARPTSGNGERDRGSIARPTSSNGERDRGSIARGTGTTSRGSSPPRSAPATTRSRGSDSRTGTVARGTPPAAARATAKPRSH